MTNFQAAELLVAGDQETQYKELMKPVEVCVRERERGRERGREREGERERGRDGESERERARVCERVCVRERKRERNSAPGCEPYLRASIDHAACRP